MAEFATPVRRLETATLVFTRCLDVCRPWNDYGSKSVVGARSIAMQSTLLQQIASKCAEPDSGFVVVKTRSSDHADVYIGQGRCVAVTVLQAETDHATNDERKKVCIDECREGRDLSEDLHQIENIRIGHHWQVNELFDLPVSQQ